jgi:hypothetical protein
MTGFNFYVYAYLRTNNSPYYIGKGHGNRAFSSHIYHRPPKNRSRIVFLESNLSEIGALALERRYIEWYGRKDIGTGILMNKTSGGDGVCGLKHTATHKAHISKIMKGRMTGNKNPAFGRPAWNRGLTKETNKSLKASSEANIRIKALIDNTKENNHFYGKTHSEATKIKMRSKWSPDRKFQIALSASRKDKQFLLNVEKDGIKDLMFFSGFCKKYNLKSENIRQAYHKCKELGVSKTCGWTLRITTITNENMSDLEISKYAHILRENF